MAGIGADEARRVLHETLQEPDPFVRTPRLAEQPRRRAIRTGATAHKRRRRRRRNFRLLPSRGVLFLGRRQADDA